MSKVKKQKEKKQKREKREKREKIEKRLENTLIKKTKSSGLSKKLLSMSMIPLLIMGILLSIMGSFYIREGIHDEVEKNLYTAAIGLNEKLKHIDDGEYKEDFQGNVFKGGTAITGNMGIIGNAYHELGLQFTVFYGSKRVLTTVKDASGNYVVGTEASEEVVEEVLNKGKNYFTTRVLIEDVYYLGYYLPLHARDGSVIGMVFAGRPSDETEAFIRNSSMTFIIIGVVLIIACLFFFFFIIRSIVKSAKVAESQADSIASGNLREALDPRLARRKDELGDIARSVESIRNSLTDTIGMLQNNSKTISEYTEKQEGLLTNVNRNADEVNKAIEGVSEGAMNQAEEVQVASEQISYIGEVIEDITACLEKLEESATNMQNASDETLMIVQDLDASNDETVKAVGEVENQINATFSSAEMISEAIDIITNIAEETNLLSLNASIEAARAGEAGRGFAVVADEIQKLADQSNESADRIRDVIEDLMKEAGKTIEIMIKVKETVSIQQENLGETKQKFDDVSMGITSSLEGIGEINRSARALDESRIKIIEIIESLSAISEENAASAEETAASVQELSANINTVAEEAQNLNLLVEQLEETAGKFQI